MFEANTTVDSKNISLLVENNSILQKLLDNASKNNSNDGNISPNVESMTKSLNHIDKRLLGSLKNKTNILLEDILSTNLCQVKQLDFISNRMIDISKYINVSNRDIQDDENQELEIIDYIKDIPLILSDQLDALKGIENLNKKVFDAQLDILYKRTGRGIGKSDKSDEELEVNRLKLEAKKLEYLNDIEDEKNRKKDLKDRYKSDLLSPNKLENILKGVVPSLVGGLSTGIGAVLSNPVTWAAGATVLAGALSTKLIYDLKEGSKTFSVQKESIDESLKKTPFQSALSQTTTLKDRLSFGVFGGGSVTNKLLVQRLDNTVNSLGAFDKQIKSIKSKQEQGLRLTEKENKLLLNENKTREQYRKTILGTSLELKKEFVNLSAFEKGIIQSKGYPEFTKQENIFKDITDKFGDSIYDSFENKEYQQSLVNAIAGGLTPENFKSLYRSAGEQKIYGIGIGAKAPSDVADNLKKFNELVDKIEELAKKTGLTKEENVVIKGNVQDIIKNFGGSDILTKIAEESANKDLSNVIYQETANPTNEITPRALGGFIPTKGTTIVGENNPEFIKNNKVISPIGKSNQTNRTTLENTIKDSIDNTFKNFGKDVVNGNSDIINGIRNTNNLLSNLINILSKENKNNNTQNFINNNISSGNNRPIPLPRNNNPYIDKVRLSNIE